MRVIRKGVIPTREILKECRWCGCLFAFMPQEVNTEHGKGHYHITCPTCGAILSV